MEYITKNFKQAKMYMDYLANGVDPVSNTDVNSDTLHKEEVIDCFRYISAVLDELIYDSDNTRSKSKFFITAEQAANIRLFPYNCKVSELAQAINTAAEKNNTRKLSSSKINDWLEAEGYLCKSGLKNRIPTEKGKQLGITSEHRKRDDSASYYVNFYSENAQKYIIDNIFDIIKFRNTDKPVIRISNIEFPSKLSVNEFVSRYADKCFILSVGSCDIVSNTGSYISALLFKGKSKLLKKTGISTTSVNKCILTGILDAVNAIKSPTEIIILTSTPLGFNSPQSINYSLCQEINQMLIGKGCCFSTAVCNGKGYELNRFVKLLTETI